MATSTKNSGSRAQSYRKHAKSYQERLAGLYEHLKTPQAQDRSGQSYFQGLDLLLEHVSELSSPRREEEFVMGCLLLERNKKNIKLAA